LLNSLVIYRRNSLEKNFGFVCINLSVNPIDPSCQTGSKSIHAIHVFHYFVAYLNITSSVNRKWKWLHISYCENHLHKTIFNKHFPTHFIWLLLESYHFYPFKICKCLVESMNKFLKIVFFVLICSKPPKLPFNIERYVNIWEGSLRTIFNFSYGNKEIC
jgi:hypothetical protein